MCQSLLRRVQSAMADIAAMRSATMPLNPELCLLAGDMIPERTVLQTVPA